MACWQACSRHKGHKGVWPCIREYNTFFSYDSSCTKCKGCQQRERGKGKWFTHAGIVRGNNSCSQKNTTII